MEVILLSRHPERLNECADLLNKEWKRSSSARVQSLERSFLELPDSLLLLEKNELESQIIGHSRLTRVLEDPLGCWIGSVVIREDRRKKGYGKYIMQKTEEYARALQFATVYLNTQDQQGFYAHLGYIYCNPVSSISFSSDRIPKHMLNANYLNDENKNSLKQIVNINNGSNNSNSNPTETMIPPPPPPPPPSTPKSGKCSHQFKSNLGQFWMKKKL